MVLLPLFKCLQILLNLGLYPFSFERKEINQPGEVLASYSSSFVEEHQQTLQPACTKKETMYNSMHLKSTFTKICLEIRNLIYRYNANDNFFFQDFSSFSGFHMIHSPASYLSIADSRSQPIEVTNVFEAFFGWQRLRIIVFI